MKPAISVIMSVYNSGAYLHDAMKSILAQTFGDFEFVVVNDGSSDGSEKIIRSFSDPRVVYIDNGDNIGQTASLNKAIPVAKGRYLARMDADDISLPERLAEQFEYLEKNDHVAVVGTWHQEIDERNRIIRKCFFPKIPTVKARLSFSRLVGWASISHPTAMIRKDILDEVGCYSTEYSICQDYDLWLRIARRHRIENIEKILLGYRVHGSSLTKKFSGRTLEEYHKIILNNLDHYMGNMDVEERSQLFTMLCNKPQKKGSDVKLLFSIFDDYVSRVLFDELHGPSSSYYRDLDQMLKIFYIPQLVKSHGKEAVKLLLNSLFRYPSTLLSRRFMWAIKNSIV